MTTANDIVQRALRKIGVLAPGETAAAENASAGLDDLNMMLAAWKLSDVDITHSPLESVDTFPLAAEYEEGAVFHLAARLAPDYSFPIGFDADDFFRKIQAAYADPSTLSIDAALLRPPSREAREGNLPLLD